MKRYYIRKLELVRTIDVGLVLEVIANQKPNHCSDEHFAFCEKIGFSYCPTFIIPYSRPMYIEFIDKMKNDEPFLINPADFRIERHKVKETNVTKIFYVHTSITTPKKKEITIFGKKFILN